MAPPEERKHIAHSGATAAIGLFTGLAADPTALNELQAISGEPTAKAVRALLAVSRGDSAGARRTLAEPDSSEYGKYMYMVYTRPFVAQAYYLLGDYETTLRMLEGFQPSAFQTASSTRAGACSAGSGCCEGLPMSDWAGEPKRERNTARSWPSGREPIPHYCLSSSRRSGGWRGWNMLGESQESGVRSQESGVRSQESGVRSQESAQAGPGPPFKCKSEHALHPPTPSSRLPTSLSYIHWSSTVVAGAARFPRKVRAPSGRLPGNSWAPQGDGQGHRE